MTAIAACAWYVLHKTEALHPGWMSAHSYPRVHPARREEAGKLDLPDRLISGDRRLPQRELAAHLGISFSGAQSRVQQAREKLTMSLIARGALSAISCAAHTATMLPARRHRALLTVPGTASAASQTRPYDFCHARFRSKDTSSSRLLRLHSTEERRISQHIYSARGALE